MSWTCHFCQSEIDGKQVWSLLDGEAVCTTCGPARMKVKPDHVLGGPTSKLTPEEEGVLSRLRQYGGISTDTPGYSSPYFRLNQDDVMVILGALTRLSK